MIAEPLERGIAEDIERGRVHMRMTPKERGTFFQEKYQWDLLASRSIWAFGPDENGPNVLLDDTLPSQASTPFFSPAILFTWEIFRSIRNSWVQLRNTSSKDSNGAPEKARFAMNVCAQNNLFILKTHYYFPAMRNVKFRVLDASLAQEPIYRGGGQIVPTARRVCYSSFLMVSIFLSSRELHAYRL